MKHSALTTVISGAIATVMLGSFSAPAFAATRSASQTSIAKSIGSIQNFTPSAEAQKFTKMMISSGLIKEFTFNKQGHLVLKHSLGEIKSMYGLSNSEMQKFQKIVVTARQATAENASTINTSLGGSSSSNTTISPQLYVSNWKVYFNHYDVSAFLFAAAEIGPAAIIAALDALATLTGGPIATVIVTVLGIIGMSSLDSFGYKVIEAYFTDRGVYLGINWYYGWPNIVSGFW